MSEVTSGSKNGFYERKHSNETKEKISKSKKGKIHSEEFKEKCSNRMMGHTINNGRKHSEETKQKHSDNTSGEKNPMFGKTHSKETIDLISKKIQESKKIKIKCEYCDKEIDKANFKKWHGLNCKLNPNKKGSETIPEGSTLK